MELLVLKEIDDETILVFVINIKMRYNNACKRQLIYGGQLLHK